ncbi:hypothetical protein BGW41_007177, partial [Actinomortierella wolfii]
ADTWLPRHRPNQQFNPFRTIDMPPAVQGVSSRRTRPRYSFKVRRQAKVHAEPDALHQYQRKDWKVLPDRRDEPVSSTAVAKTKPLANPLPPYTQDLTRKPVLKALDSEHPIVTLEFGSLHKNIIGVLHDKPDVARSVEDCLRAVVRRANDAKRQFQRVIASYLEIVFSGEIQQHDRKFLNHLCENVRSQVIAQTAEDKKNEDITLGNTKQSSFIQAILVAMISGKDPPRGSIANEFIARLRGIGLINVEVPATVYPANIIAKSVSSQLCLQLKKHFKDGSVLLHQRLVKLQSRGKLPPDARVEIDNSLSAIENFRRLNHLTNNSWKLFPLSPVEDGFVNISEYELATLLWRHEATRHELRAMMDGQFLVSSDVLTLPDLTQCWLPGTPPGTLLKKFLADVDLDGKGLTSRQKGKAGYAAAIKLLSIEQIHQHINTIRHKDFDPRTYCQKGYQLLGSFKTDGHRLQLLAYKLKELLSVRYKRYKEDILPNRLQSTVAGVDYFMTEIRNVVKVPQDVKNLLGCWPHEVREQVNVLGIDLGQACVVGASALRPKPPARRPTKRGKRGGSKKRPSKRKRRKGTKKKEKGKLLSQGDKEGDHPVYYNLAVKQKAVLQPVLKFRRWMERQKQQELSALADIQVQITGAQDSVEQMSQQEIVRLPQRKIRTISDIETVVPPIRGQDANINMHQQHRDRYWQQLDSFYNTKGRFKKMRWLAQRAKMEEYTQMTNSLLRMVDGCVGARRKDGSKVIIGVGLGKFSSKSKLSSLHESFQSFFVQK